MIDKKIECFNIILFIFSPKKDLDFLQMIKLILASLDQL